MSRLPFVAHRLRLTFTPVIGLAGELVVLIILMLLSKYYGDGKNPGMYSNSICSTSANPAGFRTAGANAYVAFFLLNEVVVRYSTLSRLLRAQLAHCPICRLRLRSLPRTS